MEWALTMPSLTIPHSAGGFRDYPFELADINFLSKTYKIMSNPGIITTHADKITAILSVLIPKLEELYSAGLRYNSYEYGPRYGNRCGDNAKVITTKLREQGYTISKIYILGERPSSTDIMESVLENRTKLFGEVYATMFTGGYHAFPLFHFTDVGLYIAIETTISPSPQFIVGISIEDILSFIKNRYVVTKYHNTEDNTSSYNESGWTAFGGGPRRRKSKTRRLRSKSRLHKKRQWTRLR